MTSVMTNERADCHWQPAPAPPLLSLAHSTSGAVLGWAALQPQVSAFEMWCLQRRTMWQMKRWALQRVKSQPCLVITQHHCFVVKM